VEPGARQYPHDVTPRQTANMSPHKHPDSKTPRKLPFKPRLSGPERRAMILDVALDAFAETGYKDTSMTAIAARADVDKAMLYRYFPSKQALYLAVLEDQTNRSADYITQRLLPAGEPGARLVTAYLAYLEFAEEHPAMWALLLDRTATGDPECAAGLQHLRETVIGNALSILANDIAGVGLEPTDPRAQLGMTLVLSMTDSAIEWWRQHPDTTRLELVATTTELITTLANVIADQTHDNGTLPPAK
jgi:AcrR family transcriptional regulator